MTLTTTTICNFHQLLSNSLTAKSPPPAATSKLSPQRIHCFSSIIQNPSTRNRSLIMSQNTAGDKVHTFSHGICLSFLRNRKLLFPTNMARSLWVYYTKLLPRILSFYAMDFDPARESEGCFQYGHYFREADDLHAVIEHFTKENRVVSAIVGHSKGGDVVLLYASKYHDVHAVVNLSGRYDLKKGIEERLGKDFLERIKEDGYIDVMDSSGDVNYRVTEESLMDRLNTDLNSQCLMIENDCRVLTVHGSADEIIPVEDAYEFAKVIPNHRLCIIEGADHCYTNHQAELAPNVSNFIVECIRGK